MKNYLNKWFRKWAKKNRLSSSDLLKASSDLIEGKSVADLGGNLFKIRVASENSGKRGAYRTIVVYKQGVRVIFLSAFAKNERANLSKNELDLFKEVAKTLTSYSDEEFQVLVDNESFFEILEDENE